MNILCVHQVWAQNPTDTSGYVFTQSGIPDDNTPLITVKWVANKIYYPGGFEVYRKEVGTKDWVKISSEPIQVQKEVPPILRARDRQLEDMLSFVHKTSYEEFQESFLRVMVMIKAILSPEFAELLGVVYYDKSVVATKSYQYKVIGLQKNGKEELVNITKPILVAPYIAQAPPKAIEVERLKDKVIFKWLPEDLRYYGVNIYRAEQGNTQYEKVTEFPRHLQKSEDQNGNITYPEISYEDLTIDPEKSYEYKLAVVDYFGNIGTFSEVKKTPYVDFDAPAPPTGLKADAIGYNVTLTWNANLESDLAGYKLYRRTTIEEEKKSLTTQLIKDTSYTDRITKFQGYYYTLAAIDAAGNETMANELFIDVRDVVPPAPPKNVVVNPDSTSFLLTWDANTEADLWGYFVYRSLDHDGKNDDNEFIVVNTEPILTNSYIEKLPRNVRNKFVYTVVAMDSSYNRSEHSALSVVKLKDITPPAAPFIKNIHTDHGTIEISWLPVQDIDLAGYYIYRSSKLDSAKYSLLTPEPLKASVTSYQDKQLKEGDIYYYYIVAVDDVQNRSKPSNVYTGAVYDEWLDHKEEQKQLAVSGLKYKYNKKKKVIQLDWKLQISDNYLGLVIYRGETPEELIPITGLQQINSYKDTSIKREKVLYYQVRTYDKKGHKVISSTLKVELNDGK